MARHVDRCSARAVLCVPEAVSEPEGLLGPLPDQRALLEATRTVHLAAVLEQLAAPGLAAALGQPAAPGLAAVLGQPVARLVGADHRAVRLAVAERLAAPHLVVAGRPVEVLAGEGDSFGRGRERMLPCRKHSSTRYRAEAPYDWG